MLELHKLFWTRTSSNCFLNDLNIDEEDDILLRDARKKTRARLRVDIQRKVRKHDPNLAIRPVFFPQGSYPNKTLNAPAHCPPQQCDIDDGCYLPMSFLEQNRPSISCKVFFKIVDESLSKLAGEEGWKLVKNNSCTRLIINGRLHIDIPLYAIPDTEYATLRKALNFAESNRGINIMAAYENNDSWAVLDKNQVLLACRDDTWRVSDPREVSNWLKRQIELKSEQLRRVIRYLKAWRDHQWINGSSPASILLMVCADTALASPREGDDKALLAVAEQLPTLLAGDVFHPTEYDEVLSDKLDEKGIRASAIRKANELHMQLKQAILCNDVDKVSPIMTQLFGSRFHTDTNNINVIMPAAAYQTQGTPNIKESPLHGRREAG